MNKIVINGSHKVAEEVEKVLFADMQMVDKAKNFLNSTGMFHAWCLFQNNQLFEWIGRNEWLHSDRWSATYDWVHDGRFDGINVPENIESCLVEYWETNALHIKKEPF